MTAPVPVSTTSAARLLRWRRGEAPLAADDLVATEEPLEIRVEGRAVAVTMRTPGQDAELAAGFLLSEGVIRSADDLLDLGPCAQAAPEVEGNVVDARLAPGVRVDFERLTRHVFASSSCGLCGKATLEALAQTLPVVPPGAPFDADLIGSLPERLRAAQPGFGATGGLHASALFDRTGRLLLAREDVGRHNALDKVAGRALLDRRLPLHDCVLLVSGRLSFELVQKARAVGVPVIAGIGAPSSLAIACARQGGQALAGFVRPDRMNLYCGAERLGLADPGPGGEASR